VTSHTAYGIGVYSYFRDHAVVVESGIKAPNAPGVSFQNSVTVFLNGNGEIQHIINDLGNPVSGVGQQAYLCSYTTDEP
jgi:hypothetical protein